ncbi:MAG: hypothetical protein IKS80_00955, partial [Bacteroidaceae bacterium]|nr:hypothetical protein [Bacteroidaceae bacterium]
SDFSCKLICPQKPFFLPIFSQFIQPQNGRSSERKANSSALLSRDRGGQSQNEVKNQIIFGFSLAYT